MLDFSDKLTVFVISCHGNPNYDDCIHALANQTCKYNYYGIHNYTPMSKAFQKMLDMAHTPYFIQVDEDMILEPGTIQKMYQDFQGKDCDIAMNCYMLKDVHLDMPICGIKIYDTEIFKKYPYNLSHPSCEVEQLERLKKDGFTYFTYSEIVGLHSPKWTPDLIYKRYYNLAQKYRLFNYHWMGEPLKIKLLDLCINHPSEINHYACEGYAQGLIDPLITKEKSL